MIRAAAFFTCLALAAPAFGQAPDAAELARGAAADLEAAHARLSTAQEASDRVAALTETLRAYEKGLVALRDGLRRVVLREQELARELNERDRDVASLVGTLQTMSRSPVPTLMLHPSGALGTARSGMMVSDITPHLNARAEELRVQLQEARLLRRLRQEAADKLSEGLAGAQEARASLSKAVADRTDLPVRFAEDPIQTALLVSAAETLGDFARSLTREVEIDHAAAPGARYRQGQWPMPVQGRILRRAGEADAAGITRPGIVVATRPGAVVTAPFAATIRYRGPLLDYGNVMILEPEPGILLVLAGMDIVYGNAGQVVEEGAPIGLMGGEAVDANAIMAQAAEGSGSDRSETLYIEVRQGNDPEDPEPWFVQSKDSQ